MNAKDLLKNYHIVHISPVDNNAVELINNKTGQSANVSLLEEYAYAKKTQVLEHNPAYQYAKQAKNSDSYKHYYRLGRKAIREVKSIVNGPKQANVISWIILHMNTATNKIHCTYDTLARRTNSTRTTIHKALHCLLINHLAKIHASCIFISPTFVMRGSDARYIRIFNDYFDTSMAWWKHLNTNDEYSIKKGQK